MKVVCSFIITIAIYVQLHMIGVYNSGQAYSADVSSANTVGNDTARPKASGGLVLDIIVPLADDAIEDFEYMPTKEGYRFSYNLTDGTKYEENGVIPRDELQDLVNMGAKKESDSDDSNSSKARFAKKGGPKNRKLSGTCLKCLAG